MAIMLSISPKNPNIPHKYLGGMYNHMWKQVMLFKPITMDEACVHAQ